MPKIPPWYLDCVVYLYKDATSAREGTKNGGSGFLVAVPLIENPDMCSVYVITNNHVFRNCGDCPAVRLNTVQGKIDVIVTQNKDWKPHPDGSDVAVCPIQISESTTDGHRCNAISPDFFVTKQHVENGTISPGDETFMVGRFVTVQGQQRNTPALRFGNVAMLPYEPIEDEYGLKQESFIIECRSIPGYSSSPVFAFNPNLFRRGLVRITSYEIAVAEGPWLLGIDWSHISNYEPIYEMEDGKLKAKRDDLRARSNTSMAAVIPAWILRDLLFDDEFVAQRDKEDKALTKKKLENFPADIPEKLGP